MTESNVSADAGTLLMHTKKVQEMAAEAGFRVLRSGQIVAADHGSSGAADVCVPRLVHIVAREVRAANPVMPDFEALADKRMSELSPREQRDAHEGWIRAQLGTFDEHTQRQLQVLLTQLDVARGAGRLEDVSLSN
ncbi:hypothetical protein [Burkholderia cenocepacia]|uniref:hypothetical protein n=1 Tax=Burkholderia cenocepacia TaxID=95486 RepID=UPI000761AC51|nr:hypothetical protein [Burkholderia cenocepacia]KWU23403.1 hypothetical protein AS149_37070 [Burkholderia cenocepacia]